MRCRLLIFTMSMAINYVLGLPVGDMDLRSEVHGYGLSGDYTSGDRSKVPQTLAGKEKQLNRSLIAGDTFTPHEMLPIAEKLFGKVQDPGTGQGFVSSTKGPKELADKLFEAFFAATKRIVKLKDHDIIGLDALQALALEGEAVDKSIQDEEVTEATQKMYLRGQIVDIKNSKPLKSHYKLVTKVIPKKIKKKSKKGGKRRGVPLAKKLPPNRHLVVNKRSHHGQRTQKKNDKYDKKVTPQKVTPRVRDIYKHKKNRRPPVRKNAIEGLKYQRVFMDEVNAEKKKANCRWKYVCTIAGDLDTCRVHTTCGDASSLVTPAQKKDVQKEKMINEFRRMVGITPVDEEVEKILEVRNMKLRPVKLAAIQRVESLAEFFNNIIVRENMESTTSPPENHFLKETTNPSNPKSD